VSPARASKSLTVNAGGSDMAFGYLSGRIRSTEKFPRAWNNSRAFNLHANTQLFYSKRMTPKRQPIKHILTD
jgi:hypothetical protein